MPSLEVPPPDAGALAGGVGLPDVLRVASLGMCVADVTARIMHANPAFGRVVGRDVAALAGTAVDDLLDDDGAAAVRAMVARVAAGDTTTTSIECTVPRAGGDDVDVLLTGAVVAAPAGPQLLLELHDISERREAEATLLRQAMHDPLTGLPNRVLFMDRLRIMIARGARTSTVTAVMFIDLDDFKDVNDGHGHKVGDAVLIEIAQRLTEVVRPFDTVTRLGGDEFVILCLDLPAVSDAAGIASRLLRAIANPIVVGHDDEVVVTSSIGIALATSDSTSADVVLHEADSAMYRAKTRGKNQVEIFDDSVRSSVMSRINTEALLRQSLRDDLLRVHYQPIYDLATGELVAVESLLRVELPDGSLLPPGQFIDVAEHSGLIIPIGAWVLGESCRQLAQWRRDGIVSTSVRVAVNLSVRQVARSDLFRTVKRVLAEAELEPGALSLELTESILMEADSGHVRQLEELRDLGIALEIDDFGTGYSSLTYLKRLPVSVIKIDRSFVGGMLVNPADRGIVMSVIGLGQALGITTIAEGVENAEQLDALWVLGCDQAQGFYLGRPRPGTVSPPAATDWGEVAGSDSAISSHSVD